MAEKDSHEGLVVEGVHKIKIWPKYFKDVKDGTKKFEIRKNDRDYKVGDILVLQEYDKEKEEYTNEELEVEVTYILPGGDFGVDEESVVMSIIPWESKHDKSIGIVNLLLTVSNDIESILAMGDSITIFCKKDFSELNLPTTIDGEKLNYELIGDDVIYPNDAIHGWFELSYAQYLTIPRSVLQSMSGVWQQKFVNLLEELDLKIDWRPKDGTYRVQLMTIEEKANEEGEFIEDWGIEIRDRFQDYQRGRRKIPFRNETENT